MTSISAVVIALALIISDFTFLLNDSILQGNSTAGSLVFVISIALAVRKLAILPRSFWRKCRILAVLAEVVLSFIIMELSIKYVWRYVQNYIHKNSDRIMDTLSECTSIQELMCYICCGKNTCPKILADILLKSASVFSSPQQCYREDVHHLARGMQRHRARLERTASKRWRGSVRRIVAAAIYNLSCFTHGCSTGWVSGVLGEEALAGGAWLAALPCLVALPAAPFFIVLADAKGRKVAAFCAAFSFLVSWLLLAWCGSRSVWAARAAAGVGSAGALALAPLYCTEIAPKARGLTAMPALTCSFGILFAYGAGGMLSSHALSLSMAVSPTVLMFSLLCWLPETPSYLISVGRIQDAAKVMCWFDGSDFREDMTDAVEEQEVHIRTSEPYNRRDTVKRRDSDTFQPMLKRSSGLESNSERKGGQSACRELFRHRRSRRAVISCLMLLSVAAGSGAPPVSSFAAAILHHSTHSVATHNATDDYRVWNGSASRSLFETSEASSMLCGTALVLGAVVATVSLDRFGRKVLLIWSCSGIACCLAILGVYCDPRLRLHSWYQQRLSLHKRINKTTLINTNNSNIESIDYDRKSFNNDQFLMENHINSSEITIEEVLNENNLNAKAWGQHERSKDGTLWPQTILLSMVLLLYNVGLGSVPYVLIMELFTINVRSLASSLILSWMWLTNFLTLRYYGTIAVSLGLHTVYYISASVTLLGSLYTYFCLPETKGKSQKEIDESLQVSLLGKRDER